MGRGWLDAICAELALAGRQKCQHNSHAKGAACRETCKIGLEHSRSGSAGLKARQLRAQQAGVLNKEYSPRRYTFALCSAGGHSGKRMQPEVLGENWSTCTGAQRSAAIMAARLTATAAALLPKELGPTRAGGRQRQGSSGRVAALTVGPAAAAAAAAAADGAHIPLHAVAAATSAAAAADARGVCTAGGRRGLCGALKRRWTARLCSERRWTARRCVGPNLLHLPRRG